MTLPSLMYWVEEMQTEWQFLPGPLIVLGLIPRTVPIKTEKGDVLPNHHVSL